MRGKQLSKFQEASDEVQHLAEKKVSIYIPEWRALTELEQYAIVSLSIQPSASSMWEAYGSVVAYILCHDLDGYTIDDFNPDLRRMGGLRGVIDHYRKEDVKFPGFQTFSDMLDDFKAAGWADARKIKGVEHFYLKEEFAKSIEDKVANFMKVFEVQQKKQEEKKQEMQKKKKQKKP